MNGESHLVISTATAAVGVTVVGCSATAAAVVIGFAAATAKLPDWDIKLHIPHRGPTHTLIACALATLAVFAGWSIAGTATYATAAALGVFVGYGMHLVVDACTPYGVPAFSPFIRRDVHLLPRPLLITTGSLAERVVVLLLAAGAGYLIYGTYS